MMEQMKPLVSVLMTAYNRESFIREAIDSVLASTYTNFELIIVDDCSHDKTYDVAMSYCVKDSRIKVFKNIKNLGDYPNRNMAASYAKGKYIKYVDSDDIIYPECLEIMVNGMELYPESALGLCRAKSLEMKLLSPAEAYTDSKGILEYYGPTGSIMVTEKYYEIEKFKEVFTISDWEMWHRMAAKWPVVAFPDNLVLWRDHPDNIFKSDAHKISVLKNYLAAKESIYQSESCPIPKIDAQTNLKKFNRSIFKYAIVTSIRSRNIKYVFIFIKYNFKRMFNIV